MIRSTQTTLKFSNKQKRRQLNEFIKEYKTVTSTFIDLLWEEIKIPKLIPKELTSKINTWLSARAVQCSAKQASGIIRGSRKKQEQRKYVINEFNELKMFKKARKLQRIYEKNLVSKPNLKDVNPELDLRFIKIDLENDTSFDGWLTIKQIGNRQRIILPFKKSWHFNEMLSQGKIKGGVRINKKDVTFMFEIEGVENKETGNTLGIDIGKTNVISCSNNHISKPNKHNHDLNSILNIMSRKKKGSKGFSRCKDHRTNYINWSINQLNLNNTKQVNLENIKHIRKGRKNSRMLSHWTYTTIFDKLVSRCEEQGVLVLRISPTYTSQRCSKCGWVRKSNRKQKQFKCDKCSFECDSDLNASVNLSLNLKAISKKKRLLQKNRTGFYWNEVRQEYIVPVALKTG
ncbi:MAG TPA: transposase [Candidatus Glassbacteria bacterium]|nr:transposase [Candidatus Glassbacteria bacterium]